MLYRAYIDDSSDQDKKIAVVAGAFIASVGEWSKLRPRWKNRLKRDGLKYFRSSDYSKLTGEFSKFRDLAKYPKPEGSNAARALRDDLEAIVGETIIDGISNIIPMDIYNEFRATVPRASEIFTADAFEAALQTTMIECAFAVRDHFAGTNNQVAFICDGSSKAAKYTKLYTEFKKKNPKIAQVMRRIVHLDDKKLIPLQAADMMANATKELAVKMIQEHGPELRKTSKEPKMYTKFVTPTRLKQSMRRVTIWDWNFMMTVFKAQK